MSSGGFRMGGGGRSSRSSSSSRSYRSRSSGGSGSNDPGANIFACVVMLIIITAIIVIGGPLAFTLVITSNYSDSSVAWNSPMSAVVTKSSTLLGFGSGFSARFQGNTIGRFPINVWFVKNTLPTISSTTRELRYPPQDIERIDAQYVTWHLLHGSTVDFTVDYTSSEISASLRTLGLTQDQFESFYNNDVSFLRNFGGMHDWRSYPNFKSTHKYTPKIDADDHNGRRYLLTFFLDDREERQEAFISGNITYTVHATFYLEPPQNIVVGQCELSESNTICERNGLDWDYVIFQSQAGIIEDVEFASATEAVTYKYKANAGIIAGIVFIVIGFVVGVCAVAAIILAITMALVVYFFIIPARKKKKRKEEEKSRANARAAATTAITTANNNNNANYPPGPSGHDYELSVVQQPPPNPYDSLPPHLQTYYDRRTQSVGDEKQSNGQAPMQQAGPHFDPYAPPMTVQEQQQQQQSVPYGPYSLPTIGQEQQQQQQQSVPYAPYAPGASSEGEQTHYYGGVQGYGAPSLPPSSTGQDPVLYGGSYVPPSSHQQNHHPDTL